MKKFIWLLLPLLLSACSSSRITHSWKSDSLPPTAYQKILVVALIQDADRSLQEQMEQHFVGDLQEMGFTAVASLNEYGPRAFQNMSEADVVNRLKNSGVDAIITIVLLNKEKERRYVPGHVQYTPYVYYQRRFWRYYGLMQYRVYEPGYYVTDTRYFWESNFYAGNGDQLLYSAQTRSFDPANTSGMAHEYGKNIVKDLLKQGVLRK